jgi:uroporphyrinogen decarboxylase
MPNYANLKKALLCQGEPDYVPALEYAVDAAIKKQFLGRAPASIDDEAEFALAAGYDAVPCLFGMKLTLYQRSDAARGDSAPMALADDFYAADGEKSQRAWAREQTGVIHDQASFDNFDWPDPDQYRYEDVDRLGKILPPEAKVFPLVGYLFAAAWMLMGFERFCLDVAAGASLAGKVIHRLGEIHERVVLNLLDYDCVGAIVMPDDIAYTHSLMVSPSVLREYVFPWHKRIGQHVRSKGLPYLFHSDGRYVEVVEDLIECGYNALHPCEPASMDIVQLKKRYAGQLCLCGNIDLDSTLTLGTPEQVAEEVKRRIQTVAPGGGYCCGSSNSVTDYVPFENFQALLAATRKYGRYPIAV